MDQQQTLQWLDSILPVSLKVARGGGDFSIGAGLVSGHGVACTTDFSGVDIGLTLEERPEFDVRVELMALAAVGASPRHGMEAAVRVLGTAADGLAAGHAPVAPGTLIEDLGSRAGLDAALTARHGLLAAPIAWQGQVPQVVENPGEVSGTGATPARGRQTMVLQILMLTSAEYAIARDRGVGNLFASWTRAGVDPGDWARGDAPDATR